MNGSHGPEPLPISPERAFAQELRQMLDRATEPASAGLPWSEVIRTIVEAAERMADAKDREERDRRRIIDLYDAAHAEAQAITARR